jgi:hypothetical protein
VLIYRLVLNWIMKLRFKEHDMAGRPTLYSMLDEIFVVCPRCQSRARIAPTVHVESWELTPRRFTCDHCGLVKTWEGTGMSHTWWGASQVEPYFQLPLWLRTSCCGNALWFLNYRHMDLVEQYVRAELREKTKHPQFGWFNQSLFNRLPEFVKKAKHREGVLKAIEKLKSSS